MRIDLIYPRAYEILLHVSLMKLIKASSHIELLSFGERKMLNPRFGIRFRKVLTGDPQPWISTSCALRTRV